MYFLVRSDPGEGWGSARSCKNNGFKCLPKALDDLENAFFGPIWPWGWMGAARNVKKWLSNVSH